MGSAVYLRNEYLYQPAPLHVATCNNMEIQALLRADASLGLSTSVAWPTNNLAIYTPICLDSYFTVARFFVLNGSNITGSVDVGIYDGAMNRLLSTGSTVRATTNGVQYIDVSNRTFPPGNYYLGLVGSSTTGTYGAGSFSAAHIGRVAGMLQEALGATTLPTTITPAAFAQVRLFVYGFTQSDTL